MDVSSLHLLPSPHANLAGTLPLEWSRLLELRDFRLINAPNVTGPLPSTWGSLPKLERVLIYNTGEGWGWGKQCKGGE